MSDNSDTALSRRGFLAGSGSAGLAGLLAGCSELPNQMDAQSGDSTNKAESEFTRIGDSWLTFGAANNWGVRYNDVRNEFQVVHMPFGQNSRSNIRIEADENGDRGDVYIDDSLIVRNEFETSAGSTTDPSYTFTNNNNTGLYQPDSGVLGITAAGQRTAVFDNGTTRVNGDVTATDGPKTKLWDGSAGHSPNLPATTVTVSGDGSTTSFSLEHPLDTRPSVATVTPSSADAAGTFWVQTKGRDAVTITYESAPPNGRANLTYELIVSE
ncbi:twin-arginine translocation signal domain-containing protein [Halomicroarcula sp. GCM10025817]|uniref:twin-arginine translocation signal domain-containing protein n=1 Tax=Haloarcula TaxID=2237 RepID=UPI0023E83B5C|nr:twin-arginine translocation signal domain-containing protein [Halomicroarcula sp. SYNS111]